MTIFGNSRDQNIKTLNSKSLQVTLIKTMPTVKETSEAKSVAWICRNSHKLKSCDVIKVL